MKNLEKFKGNELTRSQYSQILGSRSKSTCIVNEGGPQYAEITTIDRNDGTVIIRITYHNN